MGIVESIVREITQEIEPLGEGSFGEVIIDRRLFEVLPLEEFLAPEPDVFEDERALVGQTDSNLLGAYIMMRSPGQVILFKENIRMFFWGLVAKVLPNIQAVTKTDLVAGARLVTLKTYFHELFHFDCDIQRRLFGSYHERIKEEAFAVAWSRRKLIEERQKWQGQIGRMTGVFYHQLMSEAFNYRSQGYKDWPLYGDDASFKEAFTEYVKPGNYRALRASGIAVEELVFTMLGTARSGFIEKVL